MPSRTPSRSISSASRSSTRRSTLSDAVSPAEQAERDAREAKAKLIAAACEDSNLNAIVDLATSARGLIDDGWRRTAWPLLLGCPGDNPPSDSWKELPPHRDEAQVALDVNRAFVYYPKNESDKQLDQRKKELSDVIIELLRRHPALCYFQGYHDVVQVLLLVLGRDAPPAVARLSLLRIRDFLLPTLDPAISHLELLHPIIQAADPILYNHLPNGNAFFALSGTITMFAHVIQEYTDISRLFDFFLARDTVVPIYFFAAVVLSRRDELLEIEKEEVDIFHAVLGKLPQPFDLEFHIARTLELYERIPPEALRSWAWWRVSSASVLKTTRTPLEITKASLEDGERLFQQQAKEVARQQTLRNAIRSTKYIRRQMWYYRRPGAYGLAIAVGLYAIWLGRSGSINTRSMNFGPLGDLMKRIMGVFH